MIISTYTIISPSEAGRCASCDAPLAVGDTAREMNGKVYCSVECIADGVGRLMGKLHGAGEIQAEKGQ